MKKKKIIVTGVLLFTLICSPCSGLFTAEATVLPAFCTLTSDLPEENKGTAEEITPSIATSSTEGQEIVEMTPYQKARSRFWLIFCIIFGVGVCLAIALWGSPQQSLKERYRAVRKKQKKEQKRLQMLAKEKQKEEQKKRKE